tara:strand:- start:3818 stop:4057 length:240 start_codon:yes stop_codon:yes gene_type:complete
MISKVEAINKILSYKTWTDKKKVDSLLELDCSMYAALGIDSTVKDKDIVIKDSRNIYKAIKQIAPILGTTLISAMDKNN